VVEFSQSKLAIPWFRKALREALNALQEKGFGAVGDPLDHHRVTLFKHQRWCWRRVPFLGPFMVPKLRSGHLTQRTGAVFRVPDHAEKVEGIAGMAFRKGKTVIVTGLPDLRDLTATDEDFSIYAEQSSVSVPWLKKHRPHARSYMGIPLKIAGTIRWVLVVDSREPNSRLALERIERRYKGVSMYLLKLLENMP